MTDEPRDRDQRPEGARDWSDADPSDDFRRAEREARETHEAAREAEREAHEQLREAARAPRRAAREERRRSHRINVTGHGVHFDAMDIDGVGIGAFAKGFMKDFMKDVGGDAYTEATSGEFTFEGMPRLRVRNISGETTIRVGEAGKIGVVATKHVSAGSEDRAKRLLQNLEIRMEQHGDELRIEPHLYEQERSWVDLFRGKRFRVDFAITVPRECAIDAQTVSGDLAVSGITGPHDVQAVSGDVSIADAEGPLRLKTVSGDVEIRRYVGHVEGNTVSGDVTFDAARIRSLGLQTVSGDVTVKGIREPARAHRIKTISGDVQLTLVDPDMVLEFHTTSGDLECDAPAQVIKRGRKEFTVTTGAGRGHNVVKTVSGDLNVATGSFPVPGEPSGEEPRPWSAPPEPPRAEDVEKTIPLEPQQPRPEVRDLLERLAKGEVGVDEVAAALDEARRSAPGGRSPLDR